MGDDGDGQEERYALAARAFGPALERLARAYEADADRRRDLVQEIHLALWRSLAGFDGRCSLRTWVYRVAHNVGAGHILKQRSRGRGPGGGLVSLDEVELAAPGASPEEAVGERQALERLMALIRGLKPADRQLMLLYLEDLPAAEIAQVTGLTPGSVATRIHRIKAVMARTFQQGSQP